MVELEEKYSLVVWLLLDGFCDFLYVLDILAQTRLGTTDTAQETLTPTGPHRLGFLTPEGEMEVTAQRYLASTDFLLDCLSIAPTQLLLLLRPSREFRCAAVLRLNRQLKWRRLASLLERSWSRSRRPRLILSATLVLYLLIISWCLDLCLSSGV